LQSKYDLLLSQHEEACRQVLESFGLELIFAVNYVSSKRHSTFPSNVVGSLTIPSLCKACDPIVGTSDSPTIFGIVGRWIGLGIIDNLSWEYQLLQLKKIVISSFKIKVGSQKIK
jgi:hypothetical protein